MLPLVAPVINTHKYLKVAKDFYGKSISTELDKKNKKINYSNFSTLPLHSPLYFSFLLNLHIDELNIVINTGLVCKISTMIQDRCLVVVAGFTEQWALTTTVEPLKEIHTLFRKAGFRW